MLAAGWIGWKSGGSWLEVGGQNPARATAPFSSWQLLVPAGSGPVAERLNGRGAPEGGQEGAAA